MMSPNMVKSSTMASTSHNKMDAARQTSPHLPSDQPTCLINRQADMSTASEPSRATKAASAAKAFAHIHSNDTEVTSNL